MRDGLLFLAVIDVLGHGPEAYEVAVVAKEHLSRKWSSDPMKTLEGLHQALRGSRGAAAGLGVLDPESGTLRFVGVGNTSARRVGLQPISLPSRDGIVGHAYRTPSLQELRLGPDDVLLMHSDGVESGFGLEQYPQIRYKSARAIAATVVRRFGKRFDDASCLAVRYAR
jgi:serine phosphatase RsbU (regulator of sigma subunit)